jgi:hypothetical protein
MPFYRSEEEIRLLETVFYSSSSETGEALFSSKWSHQKQRSQSSEKAKNRGQFPIGSHSNRCLCSLDLPCGEGLDKQDHYNSYNTD